MTLSFVMFVMLRGRFCYHRRENFFSGIVANATINTRFQHDNCPPKNHHLHPLFRSPTVLFRHPSPHFRHLPPKIRTASNTPLMTHDKYDK